jgi:hypothetical protein
VRPVSAVGYMLENPVVSVRYSPIRAIGSDNPTVSDRVYHAGKSAGKTDLAMFVDLTAICAVKLTNVGEQNPQRPYAGPLLIRKRMRWSEPYGDIGRSAEMSDPTNQVVTAAERNSLSGKFRPARMAQRLGHCLNWGLGEIAIRVKMLVTRGRTERP